MKTILLADDSITIQKVVELTFSEADYRVISVSSGVQALRKLSEVRPDVILLDVIMPEKNGYEVCEQLKRNPATSGIPILLLTGTFEPFDKKRADAAGANGHLTKPFESQALVAKVEELIAATPSVAADEGGGRMDIISGGDVYHVDPSRATDSMRIASSDIPPQPLTSALGSPAGFASETIPAPPASPVPLPRDRQVETTQHPALTPPDPAAGGSFVAFRDMGLGSDEEGSIIPDRFDEGASATSPSVTLPRREAWEPQRDHGSAAPSSLTGGMRSGAGDAAFSGSFESEFNLEDQEAQGFEPPLGAPPAHEETAGWAPPPEAPPAETWRDVEEQETSAPREPEKRAVAEPVTTPKVTDRREHPTASVEPKLPPLTPEMIDLIAEKVVERLADRVVREVAWEVVPGVAKALVHKRIKELEESGS